MPLKGAQRRVRSPALHAACSEARAREPAAWLCAWLAGWLVASLPGGQGSWVQLSAAQLSHETGSLPPSRTCTFHPLMPPLLLRRADARIRWNMSAPVPKETVCAINDNVLPPSRGPQTQTSPHECVLQCSPSVLPGRRLFPLPRLATLLYFSRVPCTMHLSAAAHYLS